MELEDKINELFKALLIETEEFIYNTYYQPCNREFRQHPDNNEKANKFLEIYKLNQIKLGSASIRINGIDNRIGKELERIFGPYEILFKIENGENTISRLIVANYLINHNFNPLFSIGNGYLIINCIVSNYQNLINEDIEVILSRVISGGKETIDKAVEIINKKTSQFNYDIYKYALNICKTIN